MKLIALLLLPLLFIGCKDIDSSINIAKQNVACSKHYGVFEYTEFYDGRLYCNDGTIFSNSYWIDIKGKAIAEELQKIKKEIKWNG